MEIKNFREGNAIIGTMFRISSTFESIKIARNSNLDFILMDLEHSPYNNRDIADFAMAAKSENIGGFVRVPELSKGYISGVLDFGAGGVMVPMIDSVKDARKLVKYAKYPPIGARGLSAVGIHTGIRRPSDISAFMNDANNDTIAIAQIETVGGVESIEEIAAVEGIDVLFIGPNDLSVSLGCPGDLFCSKMENAILKVADAVKRNGKILGMHASAALLEKWIPHGVRLIACSSDMDMLAEGMSGIRSRISGLLAKEG